MGIKLTDFKIYGTDVSKYNGYVDWNKMVAGGMRFTGIRAGYGNTTDTKFSENWENTRGKINRFAYWYLDYYSNWYNRYSAFYGLSDEAWGKLQAQNLWKLIKDEEKKVITFLDIESGGASYSPPIGTCATRVQAIAKAFLIELDRLSGLFNGIYCSLGILRWFNSWFKNRPLWVAWYTDGETVQSVVDAVKAEGWLGKCWWWQYASDGDADDNGTGDGKLFGSSYSTLDLNGGLVTEDEFNQFFGGTIAPPEPEVSLFKVKVIVSNLNIRDCPSTSCLKIGTAIYEKIYDVYQTNGEWMRIGTNQWIFGSPSYVQRVNPSTGKRPASLYYPLPEGIRISQYFGSNLSWYPVSKGHNGIDWACSTGTPIYAMQDGKVIVASLYSQPGITNGKIGYGRHVRIEHPEGVSIYGHLSRLDVKAGDVVKAGQQIGLSGGATSDPYSGFSTGAHLHAEYRVKDLPNPVPGGYVYNAFDFLPILIKPPTPEGVTRWEVTTSAGLRIRKTPITGEIIGVMLYKQQFLVSSIDSNNWGKLYNQEGYSSLDYAKRI